MGTSVLWRHCDVAQKRSSVYRDSRFAMLGNCHRWQQMRRIARMNGHAEGVGLHPEEPVVSYANEHTKAYY